MIRESKSKKNVNNADISVPTGKQGIEKLQNSHKGLNCSITNVIHSVKDILSYWYVFLQGKWMSSEEKMTLGWTCMVQ